MDLTNLLQRLLQRLNGPQKTILRKDLALGQFLDRLEERWVPATLHVGSSETYHTISSALTASNNGDIIIVDPGTYTENLIVDKSVTIKAGTVNGGNATGTFIDAVNGNSVIFVEASNVIINGFTINGENIAARGVANYNTSGGEVAIGNLTVKNNIIENVLNDGVSLDGNALDGNISNNTIQDYGNTAYSAGVFLGDNSMANVSNNTIEQGNSQYGDYGIYAFNIYNTDPATISNNQITVGNLGIGIVVNSLYTSSGCLTIQNNVINEVSGTRAQQYAPTRGIDIFSVYNGTGDVALSNNTIGNGAGGANGTFDIGMDLWNIGCNEVSISGGSISNASIGLEVDGVDPYYGAQSGSTMVSVTGLNVYGSTDGVKVTDATTSQSPGSPGLPGRVATPTGNVTVNLINGNASSAIGTVNNSVLVTANSSGNYSATVNLNGNQAVSGGSTKTSGTLAFINNNNPLKEYAFGPGGAQSPPSPYQLITGGTLYTNAGGAGFLKSVSSWGPYTGAGSTTLTDYGVGQKESTGNGVFQVYEATAGTYTIDASVGTYYNQTINSQISVYTGGNGTIGNLGSLGNQSAMTTTVANATTIAPLTVTLDSAGYIDLVFSSTATGTWGVNWVSVDNTSPPA